MLPVATPSGKNHIWRDCNWHFCNDGCWACSQIWKVTLSRWLFIVMMVVNAIAVKGLSVHVCGYGCERSGEWFRACMSVPEYLISSIQPNCLSRYIHLFYKRSIKLLSHRQPTAHSPSFHSKVQNSPRGSETNANSEADFETHCQRSLGVSHKDFYKSLFMFRGQLCSFPFCLITEYGTIMGGWLVREEWSRVIKNESALWIILRG